MQTKVKIEYAKGKYKLVTLNIDVKVLCVEDLQPTARRQTLQEILDQVAASTRIAQNLIVSKSRKYEHVATRLCIMKIAKQYGYTLKAIGNELNRHHSTVLTGLRTYQDLYESNDRILMNTIDLINKQHNTIL